jgi:hypothetical protein
MFPMIDSFDSISVQRAISAIVGTLAKVLVPVGQWNEVLQFLFQCSQNQQVHTREVLSQNHDSSTNE